MVFPLFLTLVQLADTPEATVAAFVKAFNARDAAAIAREVDGKVDPEMVNGMALGLQHADLKVTVTKTTLAGDDAYLEADTEMSDGKYGQAQETIHLRHTAEGWKIVPSFRQAPTLGLIAGMFDGSSLFAQARSAAKKTACLSNVKQLALGVLMYSGDHDDHLPKDASRWKEAIMPYVKNEAVFHCPDDTSGAVSYFFEPRLAGKSDLAIPRPAETAMIVEGAAGKAIFRHAGTCSIAYVDGHAKVVRPDEAAKARTVSLK